MVTAGPVTLCHPGPTPGVRRLGGARTAARLSASLLLQTMELKVIVTLGFGGEAQSPASRWQLPLTSALSWAPASWPRAALGPHA